MIFFRDLNNKSLIINHYTCGYRYLFTLKYLYVVLTFNFSQITNELPTAVLVPAHQWMHLYMFTKYICIFSLKCPSATTVIRLTKNELLIVNEL